VRLCDEGARCAGETSVFLTGNVVVRLERRVDAYSHSLFSPMKRGSEMWAAIPVVPIGVAPTRRRGDRDCR